MRGRGPRQPGGGKQISGPKGRRGRGKPSQHPRGEGRRARVKPSPAAGKGGKRARREPAEAANFNHRRKPPAHPSASRPNRSDHPVPSDLGSARDLRDGWRKSDKSDLRVERGSGTAVRGEGEQPQQQTFVSTGVQNVVVSPDEDGMRVDRFLEARFPGLSFSHIQRVIRKGELRVSGKRVEPKDRLKAGAGVRIPPFKQEPPKPRDDAPEDVKTRAFLKSITLYEDDDVLVLNKPYGLAVQGGSGTTRHIDGMLGVLRSRDGQRPRLVHRLDKDTAGCLLVAKTRFAAAALAKNFRHRSARKIYWALVVEVPKPKQGRISTFLAKEQMEEDSFMRVAEHGAEGAAHAVTYYAVVETAAQKLAWLSLKPVTGRTHQLRAHLDHIGHPIVGDPKYFAKENWEMPGGIQNRLHLLARRIAIPHPRGGTIDVTAPLPPHMMQSWNLLGFDSGRYDPIEQAPNEE